MKVSSFLACAILFTASIAGCAMQPTTASDAAGDSSDTRKITAERAMNAVAIGRTQGDVRAALGEATVVRFDSGYEVWVYPISDDAAARPGSVRTRSQQERRTDRTEFVILFAPSGRVTKTRLRSEPSPVQ